MKGSRASFHTLSIRESRSGAAWSTVPVERLEWHDLYIFSPFLALVLRLESLRGTGGVCLGFDPLVYFLREMLRVRRVWGWGLRRAERAKGAAGARLARGRGAGGAGGGRGRPETDR